MILAFEKFSSTLDFILFFKLLIVVYLLVFLFLKSFDSMLGQLHSLFTDRP